MRRPRNRSGWIGLRSWAWISSATMPAASSVHWLAWELQKVNSPRLIGVGGVLEGHLALCGAGFGAGSVAESTAARYAR